ncbi:DUF3618 domain-containing protein [Propionibacteriaceae bacterium Y2011]|uniref:DUF3618 domain-containing protein n=1 Tax=Microlunatus sp. Y2014 TaxID=3418488 RepID=UPI003B4769BC
MADEQKKPARTAAEIQSDLAAARSRLAADVAGLIDEVHPNRIKERQIEGVKKLAAAEVDNAKAQFVDAEGRPRIGRIIAIAGAAVGAVAFILVLRALGNRGGAA